MIELSDIRKVFNSGRPNEFVALDGVTLGIETGKVTALVGPSGSGKTTLLSIVGCMSRPTSGRIWLSGRETTSLPERFLTEIRQRSFGFVFQQFNLISGLSAIENAMIPAYPTGEAHASIKERALSLFGLMGIERVAEHKAQWLSGGQAQRVAIARALINNPEAIIADEPTAHLDTKLAAETLEILARLNSEGRTIIITSHDPAVYGSSIVHSVVRMRDGRIVDAA